MKASLLNRRVLGALPLCLVLMGIGASGLNPGMDRHFAEPQDRWLLLLYDDGDFDNGFDSLYSFAGEAYAHDNLEVLVLQDNFWSPAFIWQIGPNHEMIPRKYLGEVNMASPVTLEYFLKYAHKQYPGRRTILCFYDHGGGCWGACIDETNTKKDPKSPSVLTLPGMRDALEKTRPVDLVCFTAPCLMGSLEAAYELRHNTEAYVASENLSGYIIWYGTIRFICDTLKSQPGIGNHELAQAVVDSSAANYQQRDPAGFNRSYTLSAVRSDLLDHAILTVRELTEAMLASRDESFSLFNQALADIRIYSSSYADIVDLFEEAMKRCQNPTLSNLLQEAVDAIRQAILAEAHGAELPGSNGLNVYFPPPPNAGLSSKYGSSSIAFAQDARWFDLLDAYRKSWPGVAPPERRIPIPRTNGLFLPPYGAEKSIPILWIDRDKKEGVDR